MLSAAVAEALDSAARDDSPEAARRGARRSSAPDEWRQVRIPIESVEHAADQLLRLGAELQVLEPVALRRRMAATIAAMGLLYQDER